MTKGKTAHGPQRRFGKPLADRPFKAYVEFPAAAGYRRPRNLFFILSGPLFAMTAGRVLVLSKLA
ncbi:MAG: hypothetical protein ACE5G3_12590 [Gammaproteobacteria bacterium]